MKNPPSVSIILVLISICLNVSHGLTYYNYYVPDGTIDEGLIAEGDTLTLNGKEILLLSGSFHYFRVHPDHWRDTLKKLRAAGLNALETYVPWNLHEPRQGVYDFGTLEEDMSDFLKIREFLQMAKEEDLFVILRPGPYICSEWEFGGMPGWLLRDDGMKVRTYYDNFINPVENYFNNLLAHLVDLQFINGGPIIAVQIENEYSGFGNARQPPGQNYMEFLRNNLNTNGFTDSLYVTCDSRMIVLGDRGTIPGVLITSNFNELPNENLDVLERMQPNRPKMVMEFWAGGSTDRWLASNHSLSDHEKVLSSLETVLQRNASANLYMFMGGTTFGFMAGAKPDALWPYLLANVPSYDGDTALSEAGDYNEYYYSLKEMFAKYNPLEGVVDHPEPPPQREKIVYESIPIDEALDFATLLSQQPVVPTDEGPLSMEHLPINDNNGQSYGYVVYTTHVKLTNNSTLLIQGHVRDIAQVIVDGRVMTKPYSDPSDISGFGFWHGKDKTLQLSGTGDVMELNIIVENLARLNFGTSESFLHQKKGIWEGPVFVNDVQIDQWDISPLELKTKQIKSLTGWMPFTAPLVAPAMYRSTFKITGTPKDTYVNMSTWNKGVVFINGFNLGRYWKVGPPLSLYLPAPLLIEGDNEIIAFEQYTPGAEFVFSDSPIFTS